MHDAVKPTRRVLLAGFAAAPPVGAVKGSARKGSAPFDEAGWAAFRELFPLRPGLIHLNSANLAPAWRAVLDAERAVLADVNRDPSFENRARIEKGAEVARAALARLLGAEPDEIAMTRNTSEGNRTVIAGLDLKAGDEVLIWAQNHESNSLSWDVWARRHGFTVVRVETPDAPSDATELAEPFLSRITSRTRLAAFSHVANMTGIALPADQICRTLAERGVLSLVDGAQTFGMRDLDLHALGCDFYTGSGHKWLSGPQEMGVLYVRRPLAERLWPSMVSHNWEILSKSGARKFECLGQRQDGRIAGLGTAAALRTQLGPAQVEARIRHLVASLRAGIADAAPTARFLTPAAPELSAGILAFLIDIADAGRVMHNFYEGFGVSALAVPLGGRTLVRFSPNLYTAAADVDVAVRATAAVLRA